MANYVFERMTQADAAKFVSASDALYFIDTVPADLTVTFKAADALNAASITLAAGEQSLTFAAAELSKETPVFLTAGGGALALGGADADTLTSTENEARIYGFAGADTLTIGDLTKVQTGLVDGGAAADTINVHGHTAAGTSTDLISGGFSIYGGGGAAGADDTIVADGGFNHIYGNSADAAAGTTDGNDTITVQNGSNYIQGNAGADVITLNAKDANDKFGSRVQGGADGDTITVSNHGANAVNGNKGADTIDAKLADGANSLRGGADNDTIYAGTGADTLQGDAGNDTLVAKGLTALDGKGAISTLTGGLGDDVFDVSTAAVYVTKAGAFDKTVTITDFADSGKDTIDLGFKVDADDKATTTVNESDLLFTPNAAFSTVDAALTQALQLAKDHAGSDVTAINVGADTYLFIGDATDVITNIVKLTDTTASTLTTDSFVTH